ncbi:MAG: sarcosine oxidase subunit alpha, partial [Mesorhizobium sp.]
LKKAGVGVAAIVDLRDNPTGPVIDEARALGIEVNFGRAVIRAGGKLRVSSMTVQPKNGGGERTIPVDAILMSAGWTPSVHLFSQSRGKVAFNDETKRFVPGAYAQDCVSVGACNGTDGLSATIDEAYAAGAKAAKDAGVKNAGADTVKGAKPKVDASESWSRGMLGAAPGAG